MASLLPAAPLFSTSCHRCMGPLLPADSAARPISLARSCPLLSCCGRGMDAPAEVGICAHLWVRNDPRCSLTLQKLLLVVWVDSLLPLS